MVPRPQLRSQPGVSVAVFTPVSGGHPQEGSWLCFPGVVLEDRTARWLGAVSGRWGDLCQTEKKVKLGLQGGQRVSSRTSPLPIQACFKA